MASKPTDPRRVEPTWPSQEEGHESVSEFTSEIQGAVSPFGEGLEFPLPLDGLGYRHPGPEDRPNLPSAG